MDIVIIFVLYIKKEKIKKIISQSQIKQKKNKKKKFFTQNLGKYL